MNTNSDVCASESPVERNGLSFPLGFKRTDMAPVDVAAGVTWLQVPLSSAMMTVNCWALRDGAGWAAVDVGMDLPVAQDHWQELAAANGPMGGPPTHIVATHMHADHMGMAGRLCRQHNCTLWMTRSEYLQAKQIIEDYARPPLPEQLGMFYKAGWSEQQLATYQAFGKSMGPLPGQYRRMKEGDVLEFGNQRWQVIITNGHSPEHASLFNAEQGLLISGDQLLPDVSSNVSVMPLEPWGNPMKDWLLSLNKYGTLFDDDVLVLPAHGSPFKGIAERAKQLATKRHRALDRLRAHLSASGPQRAIDVMGCLFAGAKLDVPFQLTLATGEALAYLNYLIGESEATLQTDDSGQIWYSSL